MMLLAVDTKKKHDFTINELHKSGYHFPGGYYDCDFESARNLFHKNSKLLIYVYKSKITNQKEMVYTTRSIFLSNPQHTVMDYKSQYIDDYSEVSLDW